ncbi:MAG TPA: hypothetical protein VKY37_05985 [Brumimicrobium sp.]|nr:hypothetical protein [Brumimicrobium sp.]
MKYYKALLLLVFLSSLWNINAQEGIDKELRAYETASVDDKIKLLHLFVERLREIDKDSILFYIKDLQAEGIKHQREDAIAMANFTMVFYLQDNSLFEEANQKLNSAINYYEKFENDTLLVECYNSKGNVAFLQGKITAAEMYYYKSAEYAKRSGNNNYWMLSSYSIAKIKIHQGDYDGAEERINDYIDFLKNKGVGVKMLAAAYGLLGQMYLDQKIYDKAINHFTQSMEYGLTVGNMKAVANGYTNLGIVEYYTENIERSGQYFHLALAYRIKDNDLFYISEGHYNLGDYYYGIGVLDSAIVSYKRSAEVAKTAKNLRTQKEALMQLSGIYDQQNNQIEQIALLKKIVKLQEEINEQQHSDGLKALRLSYEQTIDEATVLGGIREDELQGKVGALESVFNNWIIFTIACLFGLLAFIFFIKKRVKR